MDEMSLEEKEQESDGYSMVIYFVKPNDTLWSIAKNLRSTVEEIKRVNNLETDTIEAGRQLFVPKYIPMQVTA